GFVRCPSGECIKKEACDVKLNPIRCAENEVFRECASACEPKCAGLRLRLQAKFVCPSVCLPGKCQCQPGYARNGDGKCVPEQQCNSSPNGKLHDTT
ncbi:scavenger receptor cysteine-rich protein, partial [Aphelenchoides avenae]